MPGPISVGEIAEKIDLSLSLVKHICALLRGCPSRQGRAPGQADLYEIADEHVRQVLHDMATHISEDHAEE